MKKTASPLKPTIAPDYSTFLGEVKGRIQQARLTTARAVNHELVSLYWDIGRGIVEKQETAGWGESVVERLAKDLQDEFPDMRGFSLANLWRMKQFYLTHTSSEFLAQAARELKTIRGPSLSQPVTKFSSSDPARTRTNTAMILQQPIEEFAVFHPSHKSHPILSQAVRESGTTGPTAERDAILSQAVRELVCAVPWGHHANYLAKLTDPGARLYYLRATAQFGWSRNVLLNQIKAGAYERAVVEKKTHNFPLALPEHFAEQADEMMKSRYNLEFLGIARPMKERELETRLVERLQQFILELGYGFCFVGRQYRLVLGKKEYFVDLLFYHRFLKALVAFDLKLGPFEPEHAGKMDFYLNVLNEKERGQDDNPSIGIILCAERDEVEVEFALKSKANPIGVAEYHLQASLPAEFKGRLPTAKQLAGVVREILPASKPKAKTKGKKQKPDS
jgi:predicted nuclease of restriction endonuclease-like (RecB) superfamily